jgi:murein DD-endopeptidase MepM/ murein hydrolase activator NlpD
VASEAVDSPEVSEEEAGPAADASAAVGVAEAGGPAEADGRPGVSVGKQAEVAATDPSGRRTVLWPHPGDRRPVDGKFPGIAISARAGDAVYSVSTGRVIYAGPHTAFGRVVFVRTDDGYLYVYAGNSELSVQVGDRVRVGTRIGSVGPGGGAAGAGGDAARPGGTAVEAGQLYFSVWKNDEYVDPTDAPRG